MGKIKIPATFKRIYDRQYVCMKCHAKIKSDVQKVKLGKTKCRKCKSKELRPKSKERQGAV